MSFRARPRVADAMALALVPLALVACALTGTAASPLVTFASALFALALMAAGYERSKPALRQLMPTVTLAALAAAGRVLFAPLPDVKPVSAIAILAGATLGPRAGFATGALAALASNAFFGQGPWTPWQMYAWGLIGWLGGVLAPAGALSTPGRRTAFSLASGLLYGLLLNSWHIIGFVRPLSAAGAVAAFAAGLPWDVLHGVATAVFLQLVWEAWTPKLARVIVRYDLAAPTWARAA